MKNRSTLLVDGTCLYKIVFEGVKSYALQKQNIHAVWGFLKKLRGVLNENITNNEHPYQIGKTIVFWDGPQSGDLRREIYAEYKEKRNRYFNGIDPYYNQIEILKDILTTLGITNFSDDIVETDDCISEYIRQNPTEKIFILTNDWDYFQLISKNVYVYYLNRLKLHGQLYPKNVLINVDNFEYFFEYNPNNILLRKILVGDESDNIKGVVGFSEKSILNEIPQFIKKQFDRKSLLEYAEKQLSLKTSPSKRLSSLVSFLKDDNQFLLTEKLINLKSENFITENCKSKIKNLIFELQNLKQFYIKINETKIKDQIRMDLDFGGDIKYFLEPFLLTNFKKK